MINPADIIDKLAKYAKEGYILLLTYCPIHERFEVGLCDTFMHTEIEGFSEVSLDAAIARVISLKEQR